MVSGKSQVFPRYAFPGKSEDKPRGDSRARIALSTHASDEHGRIDNITDWCLDRFQDHYNDPTITKDDIWAYLYGVLHAPDWRNKYANNLRKDLPRIPFATGFRAFQKAGQQLIDLHLSYETCQPWPLQVVTTGNPDDPDLTALTAPWLGKDTQHRRETRLGQDRASHQRRMPHRRHPRRNSPL